MRENVVPYVTSLAFVAITSLVIAGYGIYRSFFVKKTDYTYYEEGQPGQPGEELQQEQGAGGSGQELLPSKHHDGPLDTLTAHCSVQCYRVLKISKNL